MTETKIPLTHKTQTILNTFKLVWQKGFDNTFEKLPGQADHLLGTYKIDIGNIADIVSGATLQPSFVVNFRPSTVLQDILGRETPVGTFKVRYNGTVHFNTLEEAKKASEWHIDGYVLACLNKFGIVEKRQLINSRKK